jgi:solute carrier family 25 protein 39/40
MGIPNTVLYFYAYDELSSRLRRRYPDDRGVPAVAGASARFVASLSTAPLELLRTRQAARIGAALGPYAEGKGMLAEFRTMVRTEGVASLGRGVWPTLLRDVPFSAVYWLSVERMRDAWRGRRHRRQPDAGPGPVVSAWQQAGEAFVNGSVSGMVAAAVTTPLDVLKTRSQVVMSVEVTQAMGTASAASTGAAPQTVGEAALCDHAGELVYRPKPPIASNLSHVASTGPGLAAATAAGPPQSTMAIARNILATEGVSGLWRGNTARMIKVAPACGIMISSYEIGKRILDGDAGQ